MTNFNLLLKSAISMNGISNRGLSQTLNMDRSRFQKILAGDRSMDYATLETVCSHLAIPEKLNEELRVSFAVEHFGKDNYDIIRHIVARLSEMANSEKQKYTLTNILENGSLLSLNRVFPLNDRQTEFMNLLTCMIEQELDENEVPAIYTNFSFRQEVLSAYFLSIIRSRQKYIDFRHVHLSALDDSTMNQINDYLYAYEYAGYGYNTYGCSISSMLSLSVLTPLPYFVLTSKALIFFSKDMSFFLDEQNCDKISSMHQYFRQLYSMCTPFSSYMETPEDFVKLLAILPAENSNSETQNMVFYDTSKNICASSFLTRDILEEVLPVSFPYKSYFANGINTFYETFRRNHIVFTFDHDSLLSFINNDPAICDYHHAAFDGLALLPKHKLKFLQDYYNFITSGQGEAHLLNTSKFKLPSYFHVNALPGGITLGFNFKTYQPDTKHSAIAAAVSTNPIIHKHFSNFCEFLIHSPYTYSSEHSAAIWKNALEYYEATHEMR